MYYVVLIQSSGPTLSGYLEERLGKAKSSDVASSIPECSLKLSNLRITHTKWKRTNLFLREFWISGDQPERFREPGL